MKRRNESCFGLHFDFHATPDRAPEGVGATLREEDIREMCRLLKPDFIQIDCKGHPGWASYPTACGNAMPKFTQDPLELWRRVTREEEVALYMHYSGVIDKHYCLTHPKNAVLRADGTRHAEVTRTFGNGYDEDLVIPQMLELASKYGVDGIWVDGECWGTELDYDPDTVAGFEKETGIKLSKAPVLKTDKYYREYKEYCRELFRRHIRYYTDKVHAVYPEFQIASNWAFSDHMPESVSANVDYISGDLSPKNSFVSARYAGRAIALQNKPWDLMAWNFRWRVGEQKVNITKNISQILQEAASVISIGGGFQNYITQYPDGSPRMEQIRLMKPLADFIRERQEWCFRGKILPQVAILLSTYDRSCESESLFTRNGNEKIMGMVSLICDAGHSTELTEEHTLERSIDLNPVIVVPELFEGLESDTVNRLVNYAHNGGKLIVAGANSCRLFAEKLNAEVSSVTESGRLFTMDGIEFGTAVNTLELKCDGAEAVAFTCADERKEKTPVALMLPFGAGSVALIGFDMGSQYLEYGQYLHVELINKVLDSMYTPVVKCQSCEGLLEITDLEKDGRLYIQLVNAGGAHRNPNMATEKKIQPVRDAVIGIKLDRKPEKLIQRPAGKELEFAWDGNQATINLDRIDIHEIIEVQMQ